MILPRRLMTYTDKTGQVHFCEADDERQDMNYHGKGFMIPDVEAERIGLKAYLDETGWGETARAKGERRVTEAQHEQRLEADAAESEEKAVDQGETEDKATPGPGLHIDPAIRRGGGARRP